MSTVQKVKPGTGKGGKAGPAEPKGPFVIKGWMMIVGGVAAGLLLVVGVLVAASLFTPNPNLVKAREIQQKLEEGDLSGDERRELYRQLGEATRNLPEAQKNELRNERFRRDIAKEAAELKEFFALSEQEQIARLNKELDEEEARRGRGGRGGPNGGGRPPGGGPPGAGGPGGGGGQPPGTGSGQGGGFRGPSEEEMKSFRNNYMSQTTPEFRAQRDMQRKMKENLRNQRKNAQGAAKNGT